jgi:phage tail-like protein
MPVHQKQDPLPAFRFRVYRDDRALSHVTGVSGLELESRDRQQDPKNPDLPPGPGIVLKRGVTQDKGFWDWFCQAQADPALRNDVRIVLMDADGRDAVIWTLAGAYPVRWSGPELKADCSAVAFESLELRYDRITWENPVR